MSARDRILDAAAEVLAERGVAGATTRQIAAAAGCSEALLYKNFADKQELFVAVLTERLPPLDVPPSGGDIADELIELTAALMSFFARTFPMSVSIFGAPQLLAEHRDGVRRQGAGPEGPVRLVRAHLETARGDGRIGATADLDAAARTIVGVAFHRAFLAAYDGDRDVADGRDLAERAVALLLPALRS